MSAHSEIVRDYVELRNYLAQSHPQPNMEFEVHFEIRSGCLLAVSSLTQAGVEVAKVQPKFFQLFIPHYGLRFEKYSLDLIKYINENFAKVKTRKKPMRRIVLLALKHRKSLNLKRGYEPKN